MVRLTETFTAACPDCGWSYSTGERMIRDHLAKWHRCTRPRS